MRDERCGRGAGGRRDRASEDCGRRVRDEGRATGAAKAGAGMAGDLAVALRFAGVGRWRGERGA